MLCPQCRRRVERGAAVCRSCGTLLAGAAGALELVLDDDTRVALTDELTIGRAPGSALRLEDPSVSRHHARIVPTAGGPQLEDAGSSHGTWLDGERLTAPQLLRDGSRVQIGDRLLTVQVIPDASMAGQTLVVPIGASLLLPAVGGAEVQDALPGAVPAAHPRLRSGHRVKRLGADEGGRWIVEDLRGGGVVRLEPADGELLALLDGATPIAQLVAAAEATLGASGPGRLARLLADLGERGMIAGIEAPAAAPLTGWRRLLRPREVVASGLGDGFGTAYRRGGWLLFTRPALILLGAIAIGGFVAWLALIALRYGSPLVVASHLGLGGLIFLAARGLLVALHESAHGLALASYGRRPSRAGLRLILIFPYAFVQTTESWLEPRRHRMAITAAGPVSDLVLGGSFALLCLVLPASTTRDVLFQVSFAAYVGAAFNLNPFLDRDGYHLLVDLLGRPKLRERARASLRARLSGRGTVDPDPALRRYALAGLAWSVIMVAFVVLFSLRYVPVFERLVPPPVVTAVLVTVWLGALVPVLVTVVPPLAQRVRRAE